MIYLDYAANTPAQKNTCEGTDGGSYTDDCTSSGCKAR